MKFVQLLALLLVAGGIFGCGQKGPLVMPDAQKHKRTVPTLPGAPAKPASGSATPSSPPPADPTHP
jgi:predicted small lipoprotein YifL